MFAFAVFVSVFQY